MALILLVPERLATVWTRMRINAMRHQNSVFHDLLKRVPWDAFERLVSEYSADRRVRRLSTKEQLGHHSDGLAARHCCIEDAETAKYETHVSCQNFRRIESL